MTPLATSQAKRVWSLLLKGIDLVAALGEPNALAKPAEDRLAKDSSHHRRAATPISLD